MRIQHTREDGVTVVALEGVIKLGESARQLSGFLGELLDEGVETVLLDLEAIDYVDSTGLGEHGGHLQRFHDQGRTLALLRPQERLSGLLRLTQLDRVFPIYQDREKAISELRSPGHVEGG